MKEQALKSDQVSVIKEEKAGEDEEFMTVSQGATLEQKADKAQSEVA